MAPSASLRATITTSLALIDQFIASLEAPSVPQSQADSSSHPSPLLLLTTSATSLKSAVTKLSLLTITTPFTASATISTIQPLNLSILPSLVTATLLIIPSIYPDAFVKESISITRASLRDLRVFLSLIHLRSESQDSQNEITSDEKKQVTEATGKVWEDCDTLAQFSKGGVPDFVCKKTWQWLELMKDAVKEFEEWDPEAEVGDDLFDLDDSNSDTVEEHTEPDYNRVTMSSGVKDQALRVLSRIPQSIHVVLKQRLEKMPKEMPSGTGTNTASMPNERRKVINKVLKKTREVSECIDESAEGMYMGDLEMCLKQAGKARALTIEVVEAVLQPWTKVEESTKEDQYVKRALAWIQQVETGPPQLAPNRITESPGKT